MDMVYISNNDKIVFDDYVDNTVEHDSYWVEICSHCREKYKSILGDRIDDNSPFGTCSVKGCSNEADCYVDFNKNEVEFI